MAGILDRRGRTLFVVARLAERYMACRSRNVRLAAPRTPACHTVRHASIDRRAAFGDVGRHGHHCDRRSALCNVRAVAELGLPFRGEPIVKFVAASLAFAAMVKFVPDLRWLGATSGSAQSSRRFCSCRRGPDATYFAVAGSRRHIGRHRHSGHAPMDLYSTLFGCAGRNFRRSSHWLRARKKGYERHFLLAAKIRFPWSNESAKWLLRFRESAQEVGL